MTRVRRTSHVAGAVLGIAALALAVGAAGETAADAERGRAVFEQSGCVRCHAPRAERQGLGPPLDVIRRPQGAFELAGRLWNHAPSMAAQLEKEGLRWPELKQGQMADLMAYLEADPGRDPAVDPVQGQIVLVRKGCLKCHRLRNEGGTLAMDFTQYRGGYSSPAVWATSVWNHSPRMAQHAAQLGVLYPRFTESEMASLVAFLRSASGR